MFLIASSRPTANLNTDALAVIGITVMAVILFVSSAIPLPATALLIAFFQVFFKVSRPEQVARSFAGDSMFFILGILLISNVLIVQKIDKRLARFLLGATGLNLSKLIFGLITLCAFLACFIGQHTAAAILFPVVMTIISGLDAEADIKQKTAKLMLFSLTYSSMVGGMATPSGGARNPLMIEYLWRISGIKVSYLQWMIMAMPIAIALLPVIYFSVRLAFRVRTNSIILTGEFHKKLLFIHEKSKMSPGEFRAIEIFIVVLVLWIFFSDKLGMGMIALFGVLLYMITGTANWGEISRKTNWGIILIYASSLSLGLAMKQTGVTAFFADWITDMSYKLNLDSQPAVLSSVCLVSALLSNILSHGPSVAVSGPIFIRLAEISHLNVLLIGMITALAGSFGFLTVIAAPTNTLIYASGYVKSRDFLKAGIICTALSIAITVLFAIFYWKFLGYEL